MSSSPGGSQVEKQVKRKRLVKEAPVEEQKIPTNNRKKTRKEKKSTIKDSSQPSSIAILNRSNVHVRDMDATVVKINRLIEGGAGNLTVITDFDHTLSKSHDNEGHPCAVSFEVLGNAKHYPDMIDKLTLKYARFERTMEKRNEKMEAWWRESNNAYAEQRIHRSDLSGLVKETNLQLRDGALEFIAQLEQKAITTIIFSAGIGDVITAVLKQKLDQLPSNVHVMSNMMAFDEEDRVCGFSDPVVHCYNKNGKMIGENLQTIINPRSNVLLMGDSLGDISMAEGLGKDGESVLKIGFLNSNSNILDEFTSAFDIVIVDDQTMEIPVEIMNMIE